MNEERAYKYSHPKVYFLGMIFAVLISFVAPVYLVLGGLLSAIQHCAESGIGAYMSMQYQLGVSIYRTLVSDHSLPYAFFCLGSVSAGFIMMTSLFVYSIFLMIGESKIPYLIEQKAELFVFKSILSKITVRHDAIRNVSYSNGNAYAFISYESQNQERSIKTLTRGPFKEFIDSVQQITNNP